MDFETFYSKKLKFTLTTMIAEQYCRHELFDAYMLSVCDGTQSWSGHPRDFNWGALDGKTLLSHNRYFDSTVYSEMVRRGQAPQLNIPVWHCTANMTAYICNRRALADAVEFLYKIKLDKSARSDANGKHWPQDFSESERETMLKYAREDAVWCWRLWNDYSSKWPVNEQRLSDLSIQRSQRGVQVDAALLDNYIMWSHEMRAATEKLIPWIADAEDADEDWGEFNTKPTSTKCIAEQCRRSGIPCPPVKARDGEEAYQEWEHIYGAQHAWISALTSWRSVNKLHKSFCTVKERLRPDGTMPFGTKYFGAHTGRDSGESRVNLYNMRKRPVLARSDTGLMMDDGSVDLAMAHKRAQGNYPDGVRYALDFRNLFIPRPGKRMITCDLSQIEPRVLAWCAGETEFLDMMRSGMSPYEAHGRTAAGWTGGDMKEEDPASYALFKAQILALGYQAGWEKFLTMAYDYTGLDFSADDPEWINVPHPITGVIEQVSGYGQRAKQIVKDFRAGKPRIVALWAQLDDAFKRSLGGDFVMGLPSGRKMTYRNVRCETRIEPDPVTKKPRRKSVFTAESDGRRSIYYGGKLTENLVQATARDVFAEATLALEDAGIPVLWGVYDEAICEVDSSITADHVKRIMTKTPEWLVGCPIGAEGKEVLCYQK